jgi:hypothetical protein
VPADGASERGVVAHQASSPTSRSIFGAWSGAAAVAEAVRATCFITASSPTKACRPRPRTARETPPVSIDTSTWPSPGPRARRTRHRPLALVDRAPAVFVRQPLAGEGEKLQLRRLEHLEGRHAQQHVEFFA